MKDKILGIIRHALTFIGGYIVAKGLINETQFAEIAGAAMTLVGTIWSIVSKKA
jgi:hypothetical protein